MGQVFTDRIFLRTKLCGDWSTAMEVWGLGLGCVFWGEMEDLPFFDGLFDGAFLLVGFFFFAFKAFAVEVFSAEAHMSS